MGRYTTCIAGIIFRDRRRLVQSLKPGTILQTSREPDNPKDANAIRLLAPDGAQAGYIPAKQAAWLSERLDKNRSTTVVVTHVTTKGMLWWKRVYAGIEIRTGADA
jgi:hypothetical protein